MRRTLWGLGTVLVATVGWAQPAKKAPARPAEPPPAGETTSPDEATSAPAPSAGAPARANGPKVSIAPPEEAGWTVVEVPGGYYRYRAEAGEEAGEGGGVTIVPSEPAHGTLAPRQPPQVGQPPQGGPGGMVTGNLQAPEPPPMPTMAPAPVACEQERGYLNQRLWELRGVSLDPASANVLSDAEQPLQPSAWAYVPGLGPGLASFLPTAVQYDSPTRERLAEYARCVERAQGR